MGLRQERWSSEVRLHVLEGLLAVRHPDKIFPFVKGLKEWLAAVCCSRDKMVQGRDPSHQFLDFFDFSWRLHVKKCLDFGPIGYDAVVIDHETHKFA